MIFEVLDVGLFGLDEGIFVLDDTLEVLNLLERGEWVGGTMGWPH